MERALTENEKLKRAEQIAFRRKYPEERISIKEKEKKTYIGSKILLEILILVNITIIIYCFHNKNEIFSESFLEKISSYELNIRENFQSFFNSIISIPEDATVFENEVKSENLIENNEAILSNTLNEVVSTEKSGNTQEEIALGGAVAETKTEILSENKSDSSKVKEEYSLEKPISGVVTSSFGIRESSNEKISGFHTGTDIAANSGTEILSAIKGTVILVSEEGDYGKHLKVQDGDIVTLYAHCSEILVKEGQSVEKGEKIAKVGSTGNSTGPHLHFEIRYQNRYVNPQEIFEF